MRGLVGAGPLARNAFDEAKEFLRRSLPYLPLLPKPLGNPLLHFLHGHRRFLGAEDADLVAQVIAYIAPECTALDAALVLEVARAGDPHFCDALTAIFLRRDVVQPTLGDEVVAGLRKALGDPQVPAQGRGLAALVLASCGLPLGRSEVAWLVEDDCRDAQLLGVASMLRARCLTEADLMRVLERQFDERELDREVGVPASVFAWQAELAEALRAVGAASTAALLGELTREEVDGQYFTFPMLLELFAGRFPEQALPVLDPLLWHFNDERRLEALLAAALLPPALARPRLERLCTDPVPAVAVAARSRLAAQSDHVPGEEPLSVLPQDVLEAPPSEDLHRRLLVARKPDDEPRLALRELLVAEVRDGEGNAEHAALLTVLLCDRELRMDPPTPSGHYDDFVGWMVDLHPHLGPRLERALLSLSRRFEPPDENGPMQALCELVVRDSLEAPVVEELRRRLLAAVSKPGDSREGAMNLLGRIRAPAEGWEPIYGLLGDKACGTWARNALADGPSGRAVEARLAHDLSSVTDPAREAALLDLAIVRGLPQAIARGAELVRRSSSAAEVARAQVLVRALVAIGAVKDEELLRELERPESPRFALGMAVLPMKLRRAAQTQMALRRAFIGPHPEAAGLVLVRFLAERETSATDPRLPDVLWRVPKDALSSALMVLSFGDATALKPFEGHFLKALTSGDEEFDYLPAKLRETEFGRELLKKTGRSRRAERK